MESRSGTMMRNGVSQRVWCTVKTSIDWIICGRISQKRETQVRTDNSTRRAAKAWRALDGDTRESAGEFGCSYET